ncbi:MAG: NAD(P)/FAD-dependent oxidoreductase [Candidatus Paceibacteria bacterium]
MPKKKDIETYDVIVIGGGASGMMAAGRAGALGLRVLLLEKNKRLGEKLRITGGGRCNITNATYDTREMLSNYGKAAPYLFSPFSQFGVEDTFTFFENLGLPLVVQDRARAFPKSENASHVVEALMKYMKIGKVTVRSGLAVEQIVKGKDKIEAVVAGGITYKAEKYILATGGLSHPETGSTGDGFGWLKDLGHTVRKPTPSIVPIAVRESWVHALSGRALSGIKITFYLDGKKKITKEGRVLCTHFGLSGPLILNTAKDIGEWLLGGRVTGTIDLLPTLDIGSADKKLISLFDVHKNKTLKNVLKELVPEGTASGISLCIPSALLEKKVHSITKGERRALVDILKALPITVTHLLGYERAVVADGGVSLDEVDTKTMRSRLYANLYITGDLLDINRPSGGYSLQLCWTTGFVAGSNIED